MKDLKITACLITWKRQENIPAIINSLLKHDFINEIIIRDNSKTKNVINYGRYLSAKRAKNKFIYTQDDDCIVNNLEEVYERFISEPDTICHSGISDYQKVIPDNIYGKAQMAMAGWGYFFNRDWMTVFDKYIKKYGKDYCFYREADRIFSILQNKPINFVLGDIEHMGRTDDHALSNQGDHLKYKQMSIDRALELLK